MNAIDKNAPCPCGSTKKYKHCCQRKEKQVAGKQTQQAAMVPAWLQLGMQALRSEKVQQAKGLYEQVLQVSPRNAEALLWLGVINHKQGDSDSALELIEQAIQSSPKQPQYHATKANVLKELDRLDEAIACYRTAISLKPDFAEAFNNLGTALYLKRQYTDAIDCYRRALLIFPQYAEAHNNLGIALQAQGDVAAAVQAFERALAINPNYGQALFNFGNLKQEKDPDLALPIMRKAVSLLPNSLLGWATLAKMLLAQSNVQEAHLCFQRALAILPSPGMRISDALMLPIIMGTQEEVNASRQQFERNLETLIADRVQLDDPLREGCITNFHLAYHGVNDRAVQERIAYFYEQACPSLLYTAAHCEAGAPIKGRKKRVGFISKFVARHSVAASFSGIVDALAEQENLDIFLISSHDALETSIPDTYPNIKNPLTWIPFELDRAREKIASLELDVLVYLDIGMEPQTYFLAFARLAKVQCVMGGHPVTTGIRALDYYLSSDIIETANAQEHYSEKLVRLPYGVLYFARPDLPSFDKRREELGLPSIGRIYVCPMTMHKLHPEFDAAVERILQLDHEGRVVFFMDKKYSSWTRILQERQVKSISSSVRGRIVFAPWISDKHDFMRVIEASDVVLDPFHFGIGTTAIATCSVGTPFVTRPSEYMRGRVGLYYCKLMDLMECVTDSTEDYANKAIAIAMNPSERQRIKVKMLENNHALFMNRLAIHDVIDFIQEVV